MLAEVSENSAQLESFQYALTTTQTWNSGRTGGGTLVGRMELPDKTYGGEFTLDGVLLNESKLVGNFRYSRKGEEELWTRRDLGGNPLAGSPSSVPAGSLVDSVLMFLVDVTLVGEAVEDGVTVAHYRGTTDMGLKAETVYWRDWESIPEDKRDLLADGRNQFLRGSETVDVWIDKDNRLLLRTRSVATHPTVGDEEGYTADATMVFSGYNEAFNITAPAEDKIAPNP